MPKPDFAKRYLDLLRREEDEMVAWLLEGYKSPREIGEHAIMNDNRKRYDWEVIVKDAIRYCEDSLEPLPDRVAELESLLRVHPEKKSSIPPDFLKLHGEVLGLLSLGKEPEARSLTETRLIPYGVKLLSG